MCFQEYSLYYFYIYLNYPSLNMSTSQEIKELKDILVDFITEQRSVNSEQKLFNESLDTKVENLDTKVENLDTKVESLDTKVESLDTKVESLDTKVESLDTKVERLDTKINVQKTEILKKIDGVQYFLEKHIANMNYMLLDEQKDLDERVETIETDIQEIQPQVSHLSRRIGRLELAQ